MTMTNWRWAHLIAVGTVAVASLPAVAAHPAAAQTSTLVFTDPAGDFPVAAHDVVRVVLRSTSRDDVHTLAADVVLAAPVGPVPTQYVVGFRVGATCYTLAGESADGQPANYSVAGASTSSTGLTAIGCSDNGPAPGAPAVMSVHGATVHLETAYALGLHRGQRVAGVMVAVGTEPITTGAQVGATTVAPRTGDFAATSRGFTLR